MLQILQELSELSMSLQAKFISINKAHRLIARQLEVFAARKTNGGERYETASYVIADGSFRGVPLTTNRVTK